MVLRTEDATARPGGLELIGAVIWRGIVYGVADGLLLSAFPILAVFAMFAGTRLRERMLGTIAIGLAALVIFAGDDSYVPRRLQRLSLGEAAEAVAGDVVWRSPRS